MLNSNLKWTKQIKTNLLVREAEQAGVNDIIFGVKKRLLFKILQ